MWRSSTVNCSELLGPPKPPPEAGDIVEPNSDIKFNSESIANVTVVLVLGETAVETANLASDSPEPVIVQCCSPSGKSRQKIKLEQQKVIIIMRV